MKIRISIIFILGITFLAMTIHFLKTKLPKTTVVLLDTETPTINNPTVNETEKQVSNSIKSVQPIIKQHTTAAVYDSDPIVDAQLILENNRSCFQLLSKKRRTKNMKELLKFRLSKNQQHYFQKYKTHCENIQLQHPEFNFKDMGEFRKKYQTFKAKSQWGKIISGEINAKELDDFEIQALLKQNDLNILGLSQHYLKDYYQTVIHWDLEEVLQNHQYDYVNYIRYYTHQLYLCNLGADCSETSNIMANLCYRNSSTCGMTYQQYTREILTQGQQADLKLSLNYLQRQYN